MLCLRGSQSRAGGAPVQSCWLNCAVKSEKVGTWPRGPSSGTKYGSKCQHQYQDSTLLFLSGSYAENFLKILNRRVGSVPAGTSPALLMAWVMAKIFPFSHWLSLPMGDGHVSSCQLFAREMVTRPACPCLPCTQFTPSSL